MSFLLVVCFKLKAHLLNKVVCLNNFYLCLYLSGQQSQHREYFIPPAPPPPPPLIPSAQTAFDSPTGPSSAPASAMPSLTQTYNPSPPTPALPASYTPSPTHPPPAAPPPPPPGPPTHPHSHPHSHIMPNAPVEAPGVRKGQVPLIPMSDARSDLLAAIRRGERSHIKWGLGVKKSEGDYNLLFFSCFDSKNCRHQIM